MAASCTCSTASIIWTVPGAHREGRGHLHRLHWHSARCMGSCVPASQASYRIEHSWAHNTPNASYPRTATHEASCTHSASDRLLNVQPKDALPERVIHGMQLRTKFVCIANELVSELRLTHTANAVGYRAACPIGRMPPERGACKAG
jgi:hypothetical protein